MNSNSSVIGETRDIRFSGRSFKSKRANSNSVSTSRYSLHYIISNLLIDQFSRPVNIWLLIISLVQLSVSYPEREFLYITLLPLILMLLLAIIKDAIVTYRKYQYDVKANNAPTKVWDGVVFTEINTASLTVGDFVVLYNKERVPADMILLCTGSADNKCFVDTSALLDDKDLMAKVPIESFRFQLGFENLSEVAFKLKHIKGFATVPLPNPDFSNFEGKIRLKVAPVASNVKMKNFLLRDSKIMNTNWVIGLVVYTGNDTKAWINSLIIPRKVSSIEKFLNKITVVLVGVIIIFSVISLILSVYVSEEESFENRGFTFVHFLVLYSVLVPAPVYVLVDLAKLFRIFKIQQKNSVTFRNGNILEDLGKVEYILADKTGTLTEREINVSMCLFKNLLFNNIEDLVEKESSPAQEMETKSEKEDLNNFKPSLSDKEHFIMCLAVCNKGFTTDYGESYLTKSGDERVLISTATILGVKLVKRTNKSLTILKDSHESKFYVLGTQSMSKTRKKGRIVLQTPDKSHSFLYIIGSFEAMDEVINFVANSEPQVLEIVRQNKQSGIRQLILAFKELSESEASLFSVAFQKASRSPINRQGRVESLFDEVEVGSTYLGLIGLEEAVDLETKLAVTALKHAGIKIWMLSGDGFESSLSAGFGSGVVDDSIPIVSIHDVKSEEEFLQVSENLLEKFIASEAEMQKIVLRRSSLTIFQEPLAHVGTERSVGQSNYETPVQGMSLINRFSLNQTNRHVVTDDFGRRISSMMSQDFLSRGKNIHPLVRRITNKKSNVTSLTHLKVNTKINKFTLFIDSKSLDFAWKSSENLKNLVYLLFCANSVCFTSLLPSDKTKVAKILKNNFKVKPFFLAIGDGGSDVGMIKMAGVGVGILNNEGNQAASASDIVVNDFSDLKNLILQDGMTTRVNIKKSVVLGIYSEVFLFSLLVFIDLICDYSGPVFVDNRWYISFYLLFSVLGISTITIFDNKVSIGFIENEAAVYISEVLNKDFIGKIIWFSIVGVLQAGIAIFIYYFGFNGYSENISNGGLFLFISMTTTVNILHSLFIQNLTVLTLTGPAVNLLVSVLMVIIQNYTSRSSDNYYVVSNFSESGILVLHTFLCILFQLIVSILFHFSIKYYLPSPLEYLIQNKKMKPESKKAYQELAKIFNSNKEFERSLSNGGEYSRLTLKFKISSRERKYQEYMISKRKRHYFTYLILFTLIVVIFLCVKASYDPIDISSIAIFVILAFSLVLSLLLLKYLEKSSHFLILFKVVYIYSNVLIGLLAILQKSHPSLILVYPCTFFLFLPEDWLTMVSSCTIVSILLFRSATLYMMDFTSGHDLYIAVIQFIGIYSISTMTCGVTTYLLKMQSLQQFNLLQKVKEDYEKVTSVLYYLLPSFVRKRVNNGVRYIADEQGEVSVLFCYIVGFDKITNEYSIEELTALLDEIFGKIDSLCELVGVSKIETVANTYMACAGLIDSESELKASLRAIPHARRAVELGFAILRAAGKIFLKSGEKITLKIGVHSGKVTAGVVGYHKPQFSLVGDTVNTASRMASSAEPNTIRVSKFTYDLVGEAKNFDYTLNLIDVKGKGKMETYTITLNQMKNLDNFIEHRISLSHASMASAGIQSFADESSLSCIQTEDVLEDLKIFPTTQLFELDEGTGLIEKIKWVGLGLKVSEEMKEFRKDFLTKNFSIFFIGSVMKILCDVIMLVTFLLEFMQDDLYIAIGLIIQILVLSVVMFLLGKNRQNIFYYFSLAGVYLLGLVLSIIAYLKYSDSDISAMYILIHFQLAICCSGLFFSQVFIAALLVSVFWLIILIYQGPLSTISVLLPGSIYFISIQVFTLYYWEKYIRAQHNISYMTEKELAKTESLLTQMIPKHVYDHLKDENTVTDFFFQVTIIYADIVGFTPWSSGRDAKEIVNMLSSLFTKFDKSSVENKVYKVHTIGDCYVAMGYHGGANRNPSQECANMINFAYSMLKIIKKVQKENKELNMRIGLHTGDVIGGVMGTSIVRYDIYGTDVLIANQMESNGIPGKIVISETTKSFLEKAQPKSYQYKFHTEVQTLERTCNAYELIKVGD